MRPRQVSSSLGQTILMKRADSLRTWPRRSQAESSCPTNAMASMPGANRPGKPTAWAYGSSRCSRLKSPEEDAYRTICTRSMAGLVRAGSPRGVCASGFRMPADEGGGEDFLAAGRGFFALAVGNLVTLASFSFIFFGSDFVGGLLAGRTSFLAALRLL